MKIEDLTSEQLEKAKSCASAEELVALAQDEGIELGDAELDMIAGGDFDWSEAIPKMQYA